MGFPGEPPRRQPYVLPDAPTPPSRGEHPPGSPPHDRPGVTPTGDGGWFASPGRPSEQPYDASEPRGGSGQPYDDSGSRGGSGWPYGAPQPPPERHEAAPSAGESPAREDAGSGAAPYERTSRRRAGSPRTTGEPAGAPEQPRQAMWSPYDEGPRSYRPFIFIGAGLAVLVAAGFGLAALAGSDDVPPSATASPPAKTSGAQLPDVPDGKFGFAASRTTDPGRLTLDELFKRKKVAHGGQRFEMTVRRNDTKCKDAVVGDKLQKALTGGKCNQLLRASFRDASGKIIGTVGVANLKTSASASKVVSTVRGKSLEEYLKALPGKDKVTKSLGSGEAFAGGWTHGHYAVLVWFQYKDGHLPKKTEVKKLNQAAFGAVDATVTPALEARSLTGKRP
ncbi:hypothetical protein AB0D67_28205 [Streptosporangium sp. NPDC048047]|uniref:hypothetical protein n=1 Tax=Streptosporangium sp. NPDC048047 TaxID=3155748 RepID=UPI003424C4A1